MIYTFEGILFWQTIASAEILSFSSQEKIACVFFLWKVCFYDSKVFQKNFLKKL